MSPAEIVDQIEQGKGFSSASKLPQGTSRAYFDRVLSYYGVSPRKLNRVGSHWRTLLPNSEDPAWVLRAGGIYERLNGRWSESAQCFVDAGKRAKDPVSRLAFTIGAIDSYARCGEIENAIRLGKRVARRLEAIGEPGLAARALLNLGNALLYQDRNVEARKVLLRAVPQLIDGGFETDAASALMSISSSFLYGGDAREAILFAERTIEMAEKVGAEYQADLARLNVALAKLVLNEPEAAHHALLEVSKRLHDSPLDRSRVDEYMGDAFYQLNLWDEAIEAYESALHNVKIPVHRAHLVLGKAEALESQGDSAGAHRAFRRAKGLYEKCGARGWQAKAELGLLRTSVGKDKPSVDFAELEQLCKNSPYHFVQVLLAQSELGVDRTAQALKLIRENGYAGLGWRVHYIRACRSTRPGIHLRRAFKEIQLGRIGLSSLSARTNYLKDKLPAIQLYFEWLLAKPTASRIEELREAMTQVRSVTLLDELKNRKLVSPRVLQLLEEARAEITADTSVEPGPGQRRPAFVRTTAKFQKVASRALLEIAMDSRPTLGEVSGAVLLAETPRDTYVVGNTTAEATGLTQDSLRTAIQWLTYDLLAPMVQPDANPEPILRAARDLALRFKNVFDSSTRLICPDVQSWRIPWSLLSASVDLGQEWAVSFHPKLQGRELNLSKAPNVVWLGSSPDLKFADEEARVVAEQLGNCRIIRTAKEARAMLSESVGCLHLVGHARHQASCPALSAMIFPDGPLYAYEIALSQLSVELATLSACDTGTMSLVTQTEPDGFARAFVARGAAWTLASMWPLDDEAGMTLFASFYHQVARSKSACEALFEAKCITRLLKPHPYYWSGVTAYAGTNS
jgi:tetratricopeptide (TPR) repeat protein